MFFYLSYNYLHYLDVVIFIFCCDHYQMELGLVCTGFLQNLKGIEKNINLATLIDLLEESFLFHQCVIMRVTNPDAGHVL